MTKKTHLTTKISYGKVIVRFSGGKKGPEMMKKAMENCGKNANQTVVKYSKHQYSKNDTTQTNNNNSTTTTNTNNNNSITTKHDQNNSPKITIGPFQSIRAKAEHVVSKKDNNNNKVSTNTNNNNTNENNKEIDAKIDKLFNQLMNKNKPEISTHTNENNTTNENFTQQIKENESEISTNIDETSQEISNNTNINNQEISDNTNENNQEISNNTNENNQELPGNNEENNQEIGNNTTNDILNEDFKAQIENKIKKIFNNDTNDSTELIKDIKQIENIKNILAQDPKEFKTITEIHKDINKQLKKKFKEDFLEKKDMLKEKTTNHKEYKRIMLYAKQFTKEDLTLIEIFKNISLDSCFKEEQFQKQINFINKTISFLQNESYDVPEKILLELGRLIGALSYRDVGFKGNTSEKGLEQINHSEKNGAGFALNGDGLKNYKQETNENLGEPNFILDELQAKNIIGGLIIVDNDKYSNMIVCSGPTAHMVIGIPKDGKINIIAYLTTTKDGDNTQLSPDQPLNKDGGKNKPQMVRLAKTIYQKDLENFQVLNNVTEYIKKDHVFAIFKDAIEKASSDFLKNNITSIPIITKRYLLQIIIEKLESIEKEVQKANKNFQSDLVSNPDKKAFEEKQEKFEKGQLKKQYKESLTDEEKFVYQFSLDLDAQIKAKEAEIKDLQIKNNKDNHQSTTNQNQNE